MIDEQQKGVEMERAGESIVNGLKEAVGREQERMSIIAWLRADERTCDCSAWDETECACGAWDGYKTVQLGPIIEAIDRGDHITPKAGE